MAFKGQLASITASLKVSLQLLLNPHLFWVLSFKSMYGHNSVKSFVAIDELPTLFIPHLAELPATARKYGISTVACVQSNAQLAHTYGQVGAQKI